jgi:CheY-like chemotaxis protein
LNRIGREDDSPSKPFYDAAMAAYCPACAEAVTPGADAAGRASCPRCGLLLIGEGAAPEGLYGTVLIAEDTELIRELLKDGLVAEGLAERVFTASDGQELIELYADQLFRDHRVELVVLDLEMPILGGGNAAIALRGMERGCAARPAAIVFFTGHPLNDSLRGLMKHCAPAHYLNKGADASAPRLIKRLREVMRALKM